MQGGRGARRGCQDEVGSAVLHTLPEVLIGRGIKLRAGDVDPCLPILPTCAIEAEDQGLGIQFARL
jgi:hypothetical protein